MPDMTLCSNLECSRFKECWRGQAQPDENWQSYSHFDGGEKCEMFLPLPKSIVRRRAVQKK